MHQEQTGNDRLLCLLKGFLICHCEQGSISYHVKKLDWVCKFSGRSPRLKSLSNSLVEHFNYWPGLCLGPGVQSSSLLHNVSLNLLISVDAPALWACWAWDQTSSSHVRLLPLVVIAKCGFSLTKFGTWVPTIFTKNPHSMKEPREGLRQGRLLLLLLSVCFIGGNQEKQQGGRTGSCCQDSALEFLLLQSSQTRCVLLSF